MNSKEQVLLALCDQQGEKGELVIYFRNGMQMGGRVSPHPSGFSGMYQLEAEVRIGNSLGPAPARLPVVDPVLAEMLEQTGREERRMATFVFSVDDVVVMSLIDTPLPKRRDTAAIRGLSEEELIELGLAPERG